jgi:hypothetical protein
MPISSNIEELAGFTPENPIIQHSLIERSMPKMSI